MILWRALFLFIVLLASVWLGILLQHDPGYLLISVHQWTLETTLWVALPSLLLLFLTFHLLFLLWDKINHLPIIWRQWRQARRTHLSQRKTRQGLIEFSEGHWLSAKNHLINALPNADTPLLNYLTAARAAQELGDSQLRDDYLRQAQQSMPEAKIAVELTQAQLQLANQQWEQALATLRHLQDLSPHHPYVLKLLMHLYEEMNDWPQLIALLPTLKSQHVLPEPVYQQVQQRTYHQSLLNLLKQPQSQKIQDFIQKLPKALAKDPEIMTSYCQYLLAEHQESLAESILHRLLQKQMNAQLLDLYGQIRSNVVKLEFIESLLKKSPQNSTLLLCLARICVTNKLWGKAKAYFEAGIKHHPSPVLYEELGQLLEQLNDHAGACTAYRQGLACATQSLP